MSNDLKSLSPNLSLRFLLEIITLVAFGMWAWNVYSGALQLLLTITIPLLVAIVWGTFTVQNDPSRSGKAPIAVSGIIRLVLELVIFISSLWILFYLDYTTFGYIYGTALVIHHIFSYDRILWLIRQK